MPNQLSQEDKDKDHIISLTYGIKNRTQMNISMKQTHREQTYCCQGGGRCGEERIGNLGLARCKPLYTR